jgi:hypothetical protein
MVLEAESVAELLAQSLGEEQLVGHSLPESVFVPEFEFVAVFVAEQDSQAECRLERQLVLVAMVTIAKAVLWVGPLEHLKYRLETQSVVFEMESKY